MERWECKYCGQQRTAGRDVCAHCGATQVNRVFEPYSMPTWEVSGGKEYALYTGSGSYTCTTSCDSSTWVQVYVGDTETVRYIPVY